MAILGFIILFVLGVILVIGGLLATWATTQIGDKPTLWPLVASIIGGWIIYCACTNAPFTIVIGAP